MGGWAGGGTVFQVEGTHIQRLWGKSMDGTAKRSSWNIYKQGEEEVEEGAIEVMKWNMKIYVVKATEIIKKEEKNNLSSLWRLHETILISTRFTQCIFIANNFCFLCTLSLHVTIYRKER